MFFAQTNADFVEQDMNYKLNMKGGAKKSTNSEFDPTKPCLFNLEELSQKSKQV